VHVNGPFASSVSRNENHIRFSVHSHFVFYIPVVSSMHGIGDLFRKTVKSYCNNSTITTFEQILSTPLWSTKLILDPLSTR
jgi:hypothetical protein